MNLQGKDGFTALICAAMEGEPVITQFLIKNQANLEARCTCHGATSLSLALRRGRNETVRTLIEAGANIETKDKYGWTPLTWGAAFGRYESVKLLLEKGAKANHRDSSGKTALDWAREQGHTEVVALLQNRTQRDDPDE
ncbi:MAG: ankyrin repeat domain-containing protein [Deltaproteobacteria bacterium]|nr:ankyrin repeat domain-containing protein [Deltaproteobacteria bacterium]